MHRLALREQRKTALATPRSPAWNAVAAASALGLPGGDGGGGDARIHRGNSGNGLPRPLLLRVLMGSVAAVAVAQAKTAELVPRMHNVAALGTRRAGDRLIYLSGSWRREPRSAAERLLALETKFLLFWAGQERDSVLSRSPRL